MFCVLVCFFLASLTALQGRGLLERANALAADAQLKFAAVDSVLALASPESLSLPLAEPDAGLLQLLQTKLVETAASIDRYMRFASEPHPTDPVKVRLSYLKFICPEMRFAAAGRS